MVRWASSVSFLFIVAMLLMTLVGPVSAHKSPVVEYGKAGTWRTAYSFYPRQPVVNDLITITEQVSHLQGTIEGKVTTVFSVYEDDSVNDWYGGQQYKHPNWLLINSTPGVPVEGEVNKFMTQVVIDRPGNYFVTIDLYEDGQYIGQDQRSIDVEQRTLGPLFLTFSAIIVGAVLWGVKARIL